MLRVATVLGTRPEIIRLSRVIAAFDAALDHVLVHTGQNHDPALDRVFFDELAIRAPDHRLDVAAATPAESIGRVIAGVDAVLAQARPDAVLILGDTNSALSAIAAKRRRIPVFHMEAGNRCFDDRVPEEINRRIVDHVADVNLPYSAIARANLLREGLPPDRVIVTGSPMREVLDHYRPRIDASDVLARLGLAERGYFLVSAHREENVDAPERLRALYDLLAGLADRHGRPVVVSTHPRTRARMQALELPDVAAGGAVRFLPPFGFPDWIRLQVGAHVVLSDSGTITEESTLLGFPALNLRDAHERPEGLEEGGPMLVGLDAARVAQALRVLDLQPRGPGAWARPVHDYEARDVSQKVLRIVVGYTGYVNRTVWRRPG